MEYTTQDNDRFAQTLALSGTQLLDVRTPDEYAGGHLPGAVNMDVESPGFDTQTASLDKACPVAVYCRSGMRSKTAAARLASQGFTVYNLAHGILEWNGKIVR